MTNKESDVDNAVNNYEQLLRSVTADPEDDAARLAFASQIRSSEPERAQFIESQLDRARIRRGRRHFANPTSKDPLLVKHEEEWTRTIAKYTRSHEFDRGFVTMVEMDPFMFLEYGEWLFVNAPIRVVQFANPEEGEFPMEQIASSPLLEHLDGVSFWGPVLSDRQLIEFANSSHLHRLLYFAPDSKREIGESVYDAFAAAPATRKMLRFLVSLKNFPGQMLGDTGRDDMSGAAVEGWSPLTQEGHTLEKRYGYIPWLHAENVCEVFDASYYVAEGILPAKKAGSRVS